MNSIYEAIEQDLREELSIDEAEYKADLWTDKKVAEYWQKRDEARRLDMMANPEKYEDEF